MKKVLILLVAVCFTTVAAFAQKLGHINGQKLVEHMTEYKKAKAQLDTLEMQYRDFLAQKQNEYQVKVKEFDGYKNAPDVIKQDKIAEIKAIEEAIYSLQETASQDLYAQEAERIEPIKKKALAAVEEVAKANGFAYIFDSGAGMLLAMNGEDVTKLVCAKLGIPDYSNEKEEPAPAPAPPQGMVPKK